VMLLCVVSCHFSTRSDYLAESGAQAFA